MASLVKRDNGVFYGQWKDTRRKPLKRRLSLKTDDRRTAKKLLQELDRAFTLGDWDPWLQSLDDFYRRPEEYKTIGEVVSLWLADRRRHGLSSETVKSYKSELDRFAGKAGPRTLLARLEASQIDAFVRDEAVARSTQQKRYRVLRAFLNWAVRSGYLDTSPLGRVTVPKAKATLPRALGYDDLAAVCEALAADYVWKRAQTNPRQGCQKGDLIWCVPLFWFAFYTGMRISEIARLRWRDVDFDRRLIYILRQKSGEQNTIPLNTKAREILADISKGTPDSYVFRSGRGDETERSTAAFCNRATKIFSRYRRIAGLPGRITFHSTRHGFCTMLAMAGKSAPVIKAAARHSHIQTSMRYVDVANEYLRNELDSVFA